jgi:hypothetical protein
MVKMIELVVTDREGRVIRRVAVNEDLFNKALERSNNDFSTAWFIRILRALFEPLSTSGVSSASYTDTTGTARTQDFKKPMYSTGTGCPSLNDFLSTVSCYNRLWVSCGTGTTPPTRTDYKLESEVAEGVASLTVSEDIGVITVAGAFTFTADTVISEIGLKWEGTVSGSSTCGKVLLDRTVLSTPITVPAGTTLTVVYRFRL